MSDLGRPITSEQEKDAIFHKLEPYLKMGLSVNKACLEADVSKSNIYDLINEDVVFMERIRKAQQNLSVVISSAIVNQIYEIIRKQNPKEGEQKLPLTAVEIDLVKWFALNSKAVKDEFGERKDIGFIDPEVEIRRLTGLIDDLTEGEKPKEETPEVKTDENVEQV